MINKGPFYIDERNIFGEVIVSLMVDKSNPTPQIKSLINKRDEFCANAWIINKKIGLQIKYSLSPKHNNEGIRFVYELHDSDPILNFDENFRLCLCLFGINDDVKAKENYMFYFPFDKAKYYPYSKSNLSISLIVNKNYKHVVKIYSENELVDKVKPWKKLPYKIFE